MLGPALGYALQEFWNSNADRRDYWNMVAGLIGNRALIPLPAASRPALAGVLWSRATPTGSSSSFRKTE